MTEKCNCPIELKPMEKWVQEDDPKLCRPCMLGPVTRWYIEELTEQGHKEAAEEIKKTADETNTDNIESVLTLCRKFDNVKDQVEEPLRERLKDFDCAAQTFDPDAAIEE